MQLFCFQELIFWWLQLHLLIPSFVTWLPATDPLPRRQAPGATPSKGADFESSLAGFDRKWSKTRRSDQKSALKSTLKRGLDWKGGWVCGWMVKSQLQILNHQFHLRSVQRNITVGEHDPLRMCPTLGVVVLPHLLCKMFKAVLSQFFSICPFSCLKQSDSFREILVKLSQI